MGRVSLRRTATGGRQQDQEEEKKRPKMSKAWHPYLRKTKTRPVFTNNGLSERRSLESVAGAGDDRRGSVLPTREHNI